MSVAEVDTAGVQWQRWTTDMHLLVTDPAQLARARALVDAELDAIEMAASRFRPDSEVCVLALADGSRRPVSRVFADLLTAALEAARLTDGDVDPTIGSAVIELGYDEFVAKGYDEFVATAGSVVPVVASVGFPVDWTAIEFDGESVRVPAGTILDLGASAKAVAADRCAELIARETGAGVLVNLGGDLSTAGDPPPGGWRIMVQDNVVQDTVDDPASYVTIGTGTGLATSSTQRRKWWRAGQAHHHILDPRTRASADPVWRSASVAAHSCLVANAVSTAAIIRGHRAPAWLRSLGLPARLVDRHGHESTMGGWPA